MDNEQELRRQADAIRKKIAAIDQKAECERGKALLGKCFRYRNNYSMPKTASDYWWLYVRITGMDSRGHLRGVSFQIDSEGDGQFKREQFLYPRQLEGGSGYIPITLAQYRAAAKRFYSKVADEMDKACK